MKLYKFISAAALLMLSFVLPMQAHAQLYQISLMLDDGINKVFQTATEASAGAEVPFDFYKDVDGKLVSGKAQFVNHVSAIHPFEEISTKLQLERKEDQQLFVHVDYGVTTWGKNKPLPAGTFGINTPTWQGTKMGASITPEKRMLEVYMPRDCKDVKDGNPCYMLTVTLTPVESSKQVTTRASKDIDADDLKPENMRYRVYGILTDGMNMQGELQTGIKENAITAFEFYQADGQLFTGKPPKGSKVSTIVSSLQLVRDDKNCLRMVINGEITAIQEGESNRATNYHYDEKVPLGMDQNPVVARLSKACEKGQPLDPCEVIAAFYVFPVYPESWVSK